MPTPTSFTRRGFLKLSCGALATACVGGLAGCTGAEGAPAVPIGVQLYSVRHELDEDFEGTLAELARMGFDGVEFADYHGHSAEELRAILDAHDLECCGSHIVFDDLQGERFEETVGFNQALGNNYLIIRWIDEDDRESRETFLQTIDEYNEVVERLASYDMRLGYHNHDYIFETFDGEMLWDLLAEETDERFVLQLDTGHAAGVGEDPVTLLERHPGRSASIHAKAYSASDEEAVVGEDELDWAGIMETAEATGGIEWYILEYEIEGVPPLEALEQSIENFREIHERI